MSGRMVISIINLKARAVARLLEACRFNHQDPTATASWSMIHELLECYCGAAWRLGYEAGLRRAARTEKRK